jgi:crossover junction endodeoxyribonuclease RuvC
MNIVALDLSLTATGFACSDGRSGVLEPKKLSGMERLAWILDRIVDLTIDADVIVIEAYQGFSYASKGTTSQDLAGLGTLVRFTLFELHRATVDIAPASLKKFATGKGNAKKPDMLMAAVKQLDWNGSTNDNVIDALSLARDGARPLHRHGQEPGAARGDREGAVASALSSVGGGILKTIVESKRVTCHAQHPDPKRRGQRCGAALGDVPQQAVFVGLSARRPTEPDGRIRLQCPKRDCRTWNIFDQ